MPYKDKDEYNAYMREYRKKQKLSKNETIKPPPDKIENKNLNSKPKIHKPKIHKPKIHKPPTKPINDSYKITQEEKEFLKEIIRKMNRRRYISDEITKKALDILYK